MIGDFSGDDAIYTVLVILTVVLLAAAIGISLYEEGSFYGSLFSAISVGK